MGLLSRADGVLGTDARDKEDTRLLGGCHRLFKEKEKDLCLQRTEQVVTRVEGVLPGAAARGRRVSCSSATRVHSQVFQDLADEIIQLVQE